MPGKGGGKSKAKAKQKPRNTKDMQQTLALSRDTTHGRGQEAGTVMGIDGTVIRLPRHLIAPRLTTKQRMTEHYSYSPFHRRNASLRAKVLPSPSKK